MKPAVYTAFAALALASALAACQGSFGSGGTSVPGGMNPPVNQPAPGELNPSPDVQLSGSPAPSTPPSENVSYALSQASKGLQCPEDQGFGCELYLNMSDAQAAALDASPSPSPALKGKHRSPLARSSSQPSASPSASPEPSDSPSASDAPPDQFDNMNPPDNGSTSSSPLASPSPTASPSGPQIAVKLVALPSSEPAMVNPDPKAVSTVPLIALRLTLNQDATLDGHARADFTLPKEQIGGRGFAIQLYAETQKKHNKHDDHFIGSYDKSNLHGTTLTFEFTPPKLQVKKGETWLLMLYGDELPSSSSVPSVAPSSSSSPSASSSPVPSASPHR